MNSQPRAIVRSSDRRDERTSGAVPAHAPQASRTAEHVDTVLGKPDYPRPSPDATDRLAHARDQKLEAQRSGPRSNVQQAARDIESGQLDTDLHNTPGIERVIRERYAANREDSDRQVATRSADDLADKRGQAGRPSRSRDEHQG